MAITIKEIQVSAKVTQQKKEPDLPLSRDLITNQRGGNS